MKRLTTHMLVIGLMQLAVGSRNIGRRGGQDVHGAPGWRTNVSLPGTPNQPAFSGGG